MCGAADGQYVVGVQTDEIRFNTLVDEIIRARTRINLLMRYGPEGFVRESWVFKDSDEEPKPKKAKTDGSGAGAGASKESEGSSDSVSSDSD